MFLIFGFFTSFILGSSLSNADFPDFTSSWREENIDFNIPLNYPPNEPFLVVSVFPQKRTGETIQLCSSADTDEAVGPKPRLSNHYFQGVDGEHSRQMTTVFEDISKYFHHSKYRSKGASKDTTNPDKDEKLIVPQSAMFGVSKGVRSLIRIELDQKLNLLSFSLKRSIKHDDYVTSKDGELRIYFDFLSYDGCYDNNRKFEKRKKRILFRVALNVIEPFVCSKLSQSMCLLPNKKIDLQIWENREPTTLFQPPSLKSLCHNIRRRVYLADNNGTRGRLSFGLLSSALLRTLIPLDREKTDSLVKFDVTCELKNEDNVLLTKIPGSLTVLDENDSGLVRLKNPRILWKTHQGIEHLKNQLMVVDPDADRSEELDVRIVADSENLPVKLESLTEFTLDGETCRNQTTHLPTPLLAKCNLIIPKLSMEDPVKDQDVVNFSVVFSDKSPLHPRASDQVKYDVTMLFNDQDYHEVGDLSQKSPPNPFDIHLEDRITVIRPIQELLRLTQVYNSTYYLSRNHFLHKPQFTLDSSTLKKGVSITPNLGIVYVSDSKTLTRELMENEDMVNLIIRWGKNNFHNVTIEVSKEKSSCSSYQPPSQDQKAFLKFDNVAPISCSTHSFEEECTATCGLGATLTGCAWRNFSGTFLSTQYATCSPDLTFCPDGVCDELEEVDPKLCPQDCIEEKDIKGQNIELNERFHPSMGIAKGFGVCTCNDFCQCFPALRTTGEHYVFTTETSSGGYMSDWGEHTCDITCIITLTIVGFSVLILFFLCAFRRYRLRLLKTKKREFFGYALNSVYEEERSSYVSGPTVRVNPDLPTLRQNLQQQAITPLTHSLNQPDNQEDETASNSSLLPTSIDNRWEFPRTNLIIENIIGEGEFGRVARGKALSLPEKHGYTTVAVKMLKENNSKTELLDLLSEYDLLKQVSHPNVIQLLGACTQPGGPLFVIIEYCKYGSLRSYLRQSRNVVGRNSSLEINMEIVDPDDVKITTSEIMSFAWQICKGMTYLANMKLVHRDLAARNVLLAEGKVCKISDFGLTRDIYEADLYFKKSRGRVPVKWMAIESLSDQVYTSRSDVWSFGVLLWELVTLGASPYPGVTPERLFALLKAGHRMEKPVNCSDVLYDVMKSCWLENALARPSFPELTSIFENMMKDGAQYLELNSLLVLNRSYFEDFGENEDQQNSSQHSRKTDVSTIDGDAYLLPKTSQQPTSNTSSNSSNSENTLAYAETTFTTPKNPNDNSLSTGRQRRQISTSLDQRVDGPAEHRLQYSRVLSVDYEYNKETSVEKHERKSVAPPPESGLKSPETSQNNQPFNNVKISSHSSLVNTNMTNSLKLANHFRGVSPVAGSPDCRGLISKASHILSDNQQLISIAQNKAMHDCSEKKSFKPHSSKDKLVKFHSNKQRPKRNPVVV